MSIADPRLAAALNAGVDTTTLPKSGMQVRGIRPTPTDLVRRNLVPTDLMVRLVAMDPKQGGVPPSRDEQVSTSLDYEERAACAFVRAYRFDDDEDWHPLTLSFEDFEQLDPDDREYLRDFVSRRREVAELADFRDDGSGNGAREDGGDVAPTTVDAARAVGSGSRARARSGARGAAGNGRP